MKEGMRQREYKKTRSRGVEGTRKRENEKTMRRADERTRKGEYEETGIRGDKNTRIRGDEKTRGQGDRETARRVGNKATKKQGSEKTSEKGRLENARTREDETMVSSNETARSETVEASLITNDLRYMYRYLNTCPGKIKHVVSEDGVYVWQFFQIEALEVNKRANFREVKKWI